MKPGGHCQQDAIANFFQKKKKSFLILFFVFIYLAISYWVDKGKITVTHVIPFFVDSFTAKQGYCDNTSGIVFRAQFFVLIGQGRRGFFLDDVERSRYI